MEPTIEVDVKPYPTEVTETKSEPLELEPEDFKPFAAPPETPKDFIVPIAIVMGSTFGLGLLIGTVLCWSISKKKINVS